MPFFMRSLLGQLLGRALLTTSAEAAGRVNHKHVMEGPCLKFIHIPKTGGQSIEKIGKRIGQKWGLEDQSLNCSTPLNKSQVWDEVMRVTDLGSPLKLPRFFANFVWCRMRDQHVCPVWHTPPVGDSMLQASYEKCPSFCMVRHPVTRFRSELGYQKIKCDAESYRTKGFQLLEQVKRTPYMRDCHFRPQNHFVRSRNATYCQHVLKMENFDSDLISLFNNFQLMPSNASQSWLQQLKIHELKGQCQVNLSHDLEQAVRAYYRRDLRVFGYH